MLNFPASRLLVFLKASGFVLPVVALLVSASTDTAFSRQSLSDQSLADVRGTNPMSCKRKIGDCTDYAVYVAGETNSGNIVRGDSCQPSDIGSFCISCKIGVANYEGLQMENPPPSAPIDPQKSSSPSCGLDSASTNGTSGGCDSTGVGNAVQCLHTQPYTRCLRANDFGFQ